MASRSSTTVARDGTRLSYTVHGERGPFWLTVNGYATSSFYWRYLIPRFQDRAQIITWDLKGHGASGPARDLSAVSVADSVDDARRILDAVGAERAVWIGFSLGCQILLESWRHVPERVAALIPILGTYQRPFDTLLHPKFGPIAAHAFRRLGPALAPGGLRLVSRLLKTSGGHRANQITGMVGKSLPHAEMMAFAEHLAVIHPPTWVAMGVAAQTHSAADLLAQIRAPTLVISGGLDTMAPPGAGAEMARGIPGAEHLHLPEATHTGLLEFPDLIGDRIETFLEERGLLS